MFRHIVPYSKQQFKQVCKRSINLTLRQSSTNCSIAFNRRSFGNVAGNFEEHHRKSFNNDYTTTIQTIRIQQFSSSPTTTNTDSTSTGTTVINNNSNSDNKDDDDPSSYIRLSKLIAQKGINMQMSRKSAEAVITAGMVTIAGNVVTNPSMKININQKHTGIKVAGKLFRYDTGANENSVAGVGIKNTNEHDENVNNKNGDDDKTLNSQKVLSSPPKSPRVWIAHKLKGELVAEHDPLGRPSLIERLQRGGVGKAKK